MEDIFKTVKLLFIFYHVKYEENSITAFLETWNIYFNFCISRDLGKEDISVWVDLSNWIGLGGSSKSTWVPLSTIDVESKE